MGSKSTKNAHAILNENNIEFLAEITGYDRNLILEWHETFMKDCPKGKITKKHFAKVYNNFYRNYNKNAYTFFSHVFNAFDLDQNGSIDFIEFIIGLSFANSTDLHKRLKLIFKIYDLDKNGQISKKEMEKVIWAVYRMIDIKETNKENSPKRRVEAIFQKMDLNNDGVVTEKEFITSCLNDPIILNSISQNFN